MAQQMINEQTFSAESIGELSGGTAVTHRMSVGGTVLKSLVLFVLTCAFAAVGWSRVGTVIRATSGPSWLLGYFLLIALSFLAIANPRLAPLGGFVYAALMGPSYETPAEIRAFETLGADAVGMSTVHETAVARHCGLRVAAVSAISNLAEGMNPEPLSHEQTLRDAQRAADALAPLLVRFVEGLAE